MACVLYEEHSLSSLNGFSQGRTEINSLIPINYSPTWGWEWEAEVTIPLSGALKALTLWKKSPHKEMPVNPTGEPQAAATRTAVPQVW